jgi:4-hydroxy-3-polyprenylbenzoate decarboxylase
MVCCDIMEIIVGFSGASGPIYGVRLLEILKKLGIKTHLVMTTQGQRNIEIETNYTIDYVTSLATQVHEPKNLGASIASGSFQVDGMVVAPCSMKTLAGIALGYSDNLLLRAADVNIKEKRPLVLLIRESPLSVIHLENMLKLAKIGVTIMPASPSYYHKPKSIDDIVNSVIGRALDVFHIKHKILKRWGEDLPSVN